MDEQTKQALADFIQKAIASTEQAGEFAVEQAPLVVQEYITRGIVGACFFAAVGGMLVAVATYVFTHATVWFPKSENQYDRFHNEEPRFGTRLAAFVLLVVGGGMAVISGYDALMIYIAPRVYIIEQLRGLL